MKLVDGMSGHCATGGQDARLHRACHARWETPSAQVTCRCGCHRATVVKKASVKTVSAIIEKHIAPANAISKQRTDEMVDRVLRKK